MEKQKVFYLFFLVLFLASCSSSKYSTQNKENKRIVKEKEERRRGGKGEAGKIIDYAYQFTGSPYQYGGNTPKGFDCSGFVQYVFKEFGYSLSRSTVDQSFEGKEVKRKDLKPGDLVFFKGRNAQKSKTGHVGIVVETYADDSFKFIHASSRGVVDDFSESSYWKLRYLRARRILSR
jgi:cell wall-associated NlpC family hydrolase